MAAVPLPDVHPSQELIPVCHSISSSHCAAMAWSLAKGFRPIGKGMVCSPAMFIAIPCVKACSAPSMVPWAMTCSRCTNSLERKAQTSYLFLRQSKRAQFFVIFSIVNPQYCVLSMGFGLINCLGVQVPSCRSCLGNNSI